MLGWLGTSSVTIGHRIVSAKDDSVLYSDGNVVVVWMDTQTGHSAPLPTAIRAVSESERTPAPCKSPPAQGADLRTSNCTGSARPSASFSVITVFSPAASGW